MLFTIKKSQNRAQGIAQYENGMTTLASINPRWFSPELLQQTAPASTHSDVWSFGMVCLEILSGHQPFNNISRDIVVMREIDNGRIPERPGRVVGLNDDVWALMRKCWTKKPEARPSIKEVKEKLLEIRGMSNLFGGYKLVIPLFVTNINVLTESRPIAKHLSIFSLLSRPSTDSELSFRSSKSHPSVYGSHFLNQKPFSSENYPSTIRSVISTDSGIQIREAVTDSRSIVKFNTTGNVIFGTLEGLVGQLINNFSECYPTQWQSTGLN